jgi:23S rRNA (adenine2503-C2)-methyltransferase
MGLLRNLTVDEIIGQVELIQSEATQAGIPLRNVVFMGMGEPFHNEEAVSEAVARLMSPKHNLPSPILMGEGPGVRGLPALRHHSENNSGERNLKLSSQPFAIGPRHITVSTVGVPAKMLAFAERYPKVRLALSLHSALSEKRRQLVPHAVGDVETLRSTIIELNRIAPHSPVWLEYVLLAGVNDGDEDLEALLKFCLGLRVEINIIPFNGDTIDRSDAQLEVASGDPTSAPPTSSFRRVSEAAQDAFVHELRSAGIFTTLRKSLGQSIAAACGQLIANP